MFERVAVPPASALRIAAPDAIGQLVGKWRLDDVIAIGGSAVVYRASGPERCSVALKILHRHLVENVSAVERFLQEARIVGELDHSSVPKLLGTGKTDEGLPYLVMELLSGHSLDVWLREGRRFEARLVVKILLAVLDVLERTHALNILHRDIKPSNLVLTSSGEVKLLDFGIARVRGAGELTGVGIAVGTPAYMPPEQALAMRSEVGPESDLFSLGVTALALLRGAAIRPRGAGIELAHALLPVPSCEELELEIPSGLARVLERAVNFDIRLRYASAKEMREDLVRSVPGALVTEENVPHASELDDVTLVLPGSPTSPGPDHRFRVIAPLMDLDVTKSMPASPISSSASVALQRNGDRSFDSPGDASSASQLAVELQAVEVFMAKQLVGWRLVAFLTIYLFTLVVAAAAIVSNLGLRHELMNLPNQCV